MPARSIPILPASVVISVHFNADLAPADGSLNKDVFDYQNYARQNPTAIISELNTILAAQTDKTTSYSLSIIDAISYLSGISARNPLIWNKALYLACKDHAADQCAKNTFSHTGNDGSTVDTRIARYGTWSSTWGENMAAGKSTGKDLILMLIIDDGVSSRGHRLNIYSTSFFYSGLATRKDHPTYGTILVIDYAGGVTTTTSVACDVVSSTSSGAERLCGGLLAVLVTALLSFVAML